MDEEVESAIELLRAAGTDTEEIEAKAAAGGLPGASLLRSISAFANTGTGLILLGLDEGSGFELVDIDASALASQLADACRERIEPPVQAEVRIVDVAGGRVVAARIHELPADQKPAFVKTQGMKRGSYVRVHDTDRVLTTYEVSILLSNRTQPDYDSEPVREATLADLDDELVRGFLDRLRQNKPSLFREDAWDYPIEVIRELIVNALMHRDLSPSSRGAQVRVEIYPDRLEVHNPGGLFGPVSVSDLGVRTITSSRNALLSKLLEDVPQPGPGGPVAENRGSGFVTLTRRLEAVGMARPVVMDRIASFEVNLFNASLLDDAALDELHRFDTSGWTDLQRLVVALAAREEEVTNERVRDLSGAHASDVGAAFVGLRRMGVLERLGQGRASRWRLPAALARGTGTGSESDENAPAGGTAGRPALHDVPQVQAVLRALASGALSAGQLHERTDVGTRRNVLLWLNKLERAGLVTPTEARRKNPANKWELTAAGRSVSKW